MLPPPQPLLSVYNTKPAWVGPFGIIFNRQLQQQQLNIADNARAAIDTPVF